MFIRQSRRHLVSVLSLSFQFCPPQPNDRPGCLVASVCYQERLFDREVCEINRQAVERWNARFLGYLQDIAAVHPPREPVALEDLAHLLSGVLEGGIILGKVLGKPDELERQILTFRSLVRLLFGRG